MSCVLQHCALAQRFPVGSGVLSANRRERGAECLPGFDGARVHSRDTGPWTGFPLHHSAREVRETSADLGESGESGSPSLGGVGAAPVRRSCPGHWRAPSLQEWEVEAMPASSLKILVP